MTNYGTTANQLQLIAEQWMEQVWRQRQIEAIDHLHAPHFIDHGPAERPPNNAAYKAGIAELYQAFPDWEAMTNDLVVDAASSKVAIRWTAHGTHRAPFLGMAATGKRIRFTGIEIIRIEQGQIVERWGEWDSLALLQQLSNETSPM